MGIENLGQRFEAFCISTAKEGESADNKTFNFIKNQKEWQPLFTKKYKTASDKAALKEMYKIGIIDLGNSYTKYLDEKYGNGDGKLTLQEFTDSQLAPLEEKDKKNRVYHVMANNTFDNINLNDDEYVDAKEMTALLTLFDQYYEDGETYDGKIKVRDMYLFSCDLSNDKSDFYADFARKDLKSIYKSIFS